MNITGVTVLKKKLQVFVSSTYMDMRQERQAAVEAILRAGHIPAGMELFAAENESQLEVIHRWIDDSDVFMLILGGRYGSIEPKSGKSYIELEYNYANEQKKPLFAVVIQDSYLDSKVSNFGKNVIETENGQLMKAFKKEVTSKMCRFFGDTNSLQLNIFESLSKLEKNEALLGWIRGDDNVADSELKQENIELSRRVIDLESLLGFSSNVDEQNLDIKIITEDAKSLLLSAKEDGGNILYLQYLGRASIQAGKKTFLAIDSKNSREEVRWSEAIYELKKYNLVENYGSKGENFRITRKGYETADKIESVESIKDYESR
jgi:Domain of unknown function (DUF4062)